MGARLKHAFKCLIAGPHGSGKTLWVTHLLQHRHSMIYPAPKNIVWFYGDFQKAYKDNARTQHFPRGRNTDRSRRLH